jgi:2Fe-2S ferredoxin
LYFLKTKEQMTEDGNVLITVVDRHGEAHELEAPTDMNMNLMEVCKAYDLPVQGTCGGMALCSTCHCYVLSETELPKMGDAEEDMLDQAFFVEDNSRLGCQLRITNNLEGLKVQLAPEAEQ